MINFGTAGRDEILSSGRNFGHSQREGHCFFCNYNEKRKEVNIGDCRKVKQFPINSCHIQCRIKGQWIYRAVCRIRQKKKSFSFCQMSTHFFLLKMPHLHSVYQNLISKLLSCLIPSTFWQTMQKIQS